MFKTFDRETQIILKILFIVLGLWVLWLLREVVLILLLSLVLTSAMEPLVDYFKLKKVPRSLSVITVYVVVLGIAGLLISIVAPILVDQAQTVMANLPSYTASLQAKYPALNSILGNINPSEVINNFIQGGGEGSPSFFSRTVDIFDGIFAFVTVLVISFYLSAEEEGMKKFIKTLAPKKHQEYLYGVVQKIQAKMGRWVIGQFILCFSIFLLTWIGLSLLNVPNALLLAIIAGALEILPYIGPILSAVPAAIFAVLESPVLALGVIAMYILIQKLEGLVLVPKVMQKSIGVSPLVILVALLAGYKLAGIWGLLLAVPIAGILTVIIEEWPQNSEKT